MFQKPSKRILLVEDEPIVREVFEAVLLKRGFDLMPAHNGAEGLAAFAQYREVIDLVLTDVSMPVMNGLEMVRRIQEINPRSAVILMTGYDPELIVPADLRHVCGLLRKPFTGVHLLEAIEKCLGGERQALRQAVTELNGRERDERGARQVRADSRPETNRRLVRRRVTPDESY